MTCIIYLFLTLALLPLLASEEDFYKMLGVSRDADNRAIRKAFKKIALQKHPDKNPDDKNAHTEFVRLNRAYEVLMDEEMRKKYDQFGEKGLSDDFQGGNQYQSWQFYRDNFGIYDDDAEIITLSRADFQQEVIESGEMWFVNFYSSFCSHCHQLAPTASWRKFAQEMEGALRIGAVNCAEDPILCQSQNVMGYPSLVLYPERVFYTGQRELNELLEFAMSRILTDVHQLSKSNVRYMSVEWDRYASRGWVIDFCDDHNDCLSANNRHALFHTEVEILNHGLTHSNSDKVSERKLAAMLRGLANVGTLSCFEGPKRDELCVDLGRSRGVAYYPAGNISKEHEKEIASLDPKEIASGVLHFLPELESLTAEQLEQIYNAESRNASILVRLLADSVSSGDNDREYKTLPAKLSDTVKVFVADCSILKSVCDSIDIHQLPQWVMFKQTGGYEIYYGKKVSVHDVVTFARESFASPMVTLNEKKYEEATSSGTNWIIDYFAPWCPPCLRLLHELRKLHNSVRDIRIGTVDCVQYSAICERAGVNSYPTTVFYLNGLPHTNIGFHQVDAVVEFIEDARNPSVQQLSAADFNKLVSGRAEGTIWLVDFFAPWCGPCQELAPEFRRLARKVRQRSQVVQFGTVDCDAYRQLCMSNGVNSYPTIRLFPSDLTQLPIDYPINWWRDHGSMQRWLSEFLPSKVIRMGSEFYARVLDDEQPWLVDFFAPWCGHCIQFAPVFEHIAEVLDGRVKLAKVDCDQWPAICQSAGIHAYPTVRLYKGGKDGVRQSISGMTVNSQQVDIILQVVEKELNEPKKLLKTEL
uniref:DnaJ homolog subfamily C member 10 n=1 Tax=Ascaris lumbricoides TaxID=6252 RepID=A0A9J2PHY4_ASCLU